MLVFVKAFTMNVAVNFLTGSVHAVVALITIVRVEFFNVLKQVFRLFFISETEAAEEETIGAFVIFNVLLKNLKVCGVKTALNAHAPKR